MSTRKLTMFLGTLLTPISPPESRISCDWQIRGVISPQHIAKGHFPKFNIA